MSVDAHSKGRAPRTWRLRQILKHLRHPELKILFIVVAVFLGAWFLPVESPRFMTAVDESLALVRWYAREHVLLCLVPAFFIAGAIGVFLSQAAVMKYLGAKAKKIVAYPMAAVSGTLLAVCSCTVLPLFASIHKRGAGLGPATAFLYSGPAINVLAIVLTAQVLGLELGAARAIGAIVFAVVIGLAMQLLFRSTESEEPQEDGFVVADDGTERRLWQDGLYFAALVAVLVFANWAPPNGEGGFFAAVHSVKWVLTGGLLVGVLLMAARWFRRDELSDWVGSSWGFAKQILPLLFLGVLAAGFLLGGPESEGGLIPQAWVSGLVGGNSVGANLFASVAGGFMYFATLTEVPILEGLLKSGMGEGPALALLLAGPALSLPNLLVIRGVLGNKKTLAYLGLVVVFSTLAGMVYGALVGAR